MKKSWILSLPLMALLGCAGSAVDKQNLSEIGVDTPNALTLIQVPQVVDNPMFGKVLQDANGARVLGDLMILPQKGVPIQEIAQDYQLEIVRELPNGFWKLVEPDQRDVRPKYEQAQRDSRIKSASYNLFYQRADAPAPVPISVNDPSYAKQWYLKSVNMPEAWSYSKGSKNVVVAIVDAGFDMQHSQLRDNVFKNAKELAGQAGVDDDGNGWVDDVSGFDFYTTYLWSVTTKQKRPLGPDSTVIFAGDTTAYHGTISAGIIGAKSNDGLGIAGMNWNVSMMNIRVSGQNGSTGELMSSGLSYAVRSGAKIINFSMISSQVDPLILASLNEARDSGVFVANSAGNYPEIDNDLDSPTNYPSKWKLDNVVAVTIVDSAGAQHGCYGKTTVQLGAPGWNMYSTHIGDKYIGGKNGTSFSSPMVAGAAALLKSMNPKWQYADLRRILLATVKPQASLSSKTSSGGSLDVAAALALAQTEISTTSLRIDPGRVWYAHGQLHTDHLDWGLWKLMAPNGAVVQQGWMGATSKFALEPSPGFWVLQNASTGQSYSFLVLAE